MGTDDSEHRRASRPGKNRAHWATETLGEGDPRAIELFRVSGRGNAGGDLGIQ